MVGLAADTKPSHAGLNGWRFLESDTGFLYYHNGSSWTKITGYDKTETLYNKTIDSNLNNFIGVLQAPFSQTYTRQGFVATAANPASSLHGALVGWPTGGTATITNDAAEGWTCNFNSSSSGAIIGFISNATYQLPAQRAFNTYLKVKAQVSTTTSSRFYVGFSSLNLLTASDTILATTDHGCIMGFSTATANFSVFHNDGSGAQVVDSMGLAKDTAWHIYEMAMTANGNIVCKIDGANTVTVSADLPGNATNLYGNVCMQLAAASSMTLEVKGVLFRADK